MNANERIGTISKSFTLNQHTTARHLHGIEYRILEDQYDIHDYINLMVKAELETDLESMGQDPRHDQTLNSLPKRKWRLERVDVKDVQLNPAVMNSLDVRTGRKFNDRLIERRADLRKALEEGMSIWPIVLLDGGLLVDGYCRYSTLKEMKVPEALAYIGRLVGR